MTKWTFKVKKTQRLRFLGFSVHFPSEKPLKTIEGPDIDFVINAYNAQILARHKLCQFLHETNYKLNVYIACTHGK